MEHVYLEYTKGVKHGKNTIRIRLKAYEHRILDDSAKKIVETVTKHGAKKVVGPVPLPTEKQVVTNSTCRSQIQRFS